MPFKQYWYDWLGLNQKIFQELYLQTPEAPTSQILHFLHNIAGFDTAPYWLAYFCVLIILGALFSIIRNGHPAQYCGRAFTLIVAITASIYATMFAIDFLKSYFSFLRPYAAIYGITPLFVMDADAATRAFPSGHAALAACLISSIWVRLGGGLKLIGFGFVVAVCWSRVAAGVHFPADVLAGALIGMLITIMIESAVFNMYRQFLSKPAPHANRPRLH
jgi:signal peptidase II